jgi:L-alanine-DL-glutamate epimerase-like enolase superfamily enzyme
MKITAVRIFRLEGELEHPEPFWEERLIRPIDLYPEHRAEGPLTLPRAGDGRYRIIGHFLEIETSEGVTGRAGPVAADQVPILLNQFAPVLVGQDPLAHESLWDRLYRLAVHGRKGVSMMAASVTDCALWDLKGRWLNVPVYRLLGGPTRERIPAYASMLGYSVEPERARERARDVVEMGFGATKWFLRRGPWDGPAGMRENEALVRALREAVGEDVDLMLDAWMSWDVPYTLAMAERLAELRPRWIEEPVLPDKIESYVAIRARSPVPIAGGEHEYTRWGIHALLQARACDVLQPDIFWAGGLSEILKICHLASVYDVPVIPHGHSVPASVHLIASQPPNLCPLLEYLVKWNQIHQFFLKDRIIPQNGSVALPTAPGLGMELDETRLRERREIMAEG